MIAAPAGSTGSAHEQSNLILSQDFGNLRRNPTASPDQETLNVCKGAGAVAKMVRFDAETLQHRDKKI